MSLQRVSPCLGTCSCLCPACGFLTHALSAAKLTQGHTRGRTDLLPRDGRHHHQIHQIMSGAVPVADHVAVRRVQVRLTLRRESESGRLPVGRTQPRAHRPGLEESGAGSRLVFVRGDEPRPNPKLHPEAAVAGGVHGMARAWLAVLTCRVTRVGGDTRPVTSRATVVAQLTHRGRVDLSPGAWLWPEGLRGGPCPPGHQPPRVPPLRADPRARGAEAAPHPGTQTDRQTGTPPPSTFPAILRDTHNSVLSTHVETGLRGVIGPA